MARTSISRSRNDRPFVRYFPELVAAFHTLRQPGFVLDGEILVVAGDRFDFSSLLAQLLALLGSLGGVGGGAA